MSIDDNVSSQKRILVVDDDDLIGNMLGAMLSKSGYRSDVVNDAEEAIEKYRMNRFDGVLVDHQLTGSRFDGDEVAKKILEYDPNAKIVFMSGDSTTDLMENYRDYGFAGTLEKPFMGEDLQILLAQILYKK